jgi:CDP-glycerol glycerophosphotransferase
MPGALGPRLRQGALAVLRHFPRLRRVMRRCYWYVRERGYLRLSQTVAVEEKTILFESYLGRSCACSPKAIFRALCADERFSGWRFVWSLRKDAAERAVESEPLLASRAVLVERGSDEYLRACARTKYWVVNNRMPEWVHPKPGQLFVQCWHGTPLKRLGHDVTIETKAALNTADELSWRFDIDAAKWSFLLSPSPFTSERLTSAFGLTARAQDPMPRIIEEGYPRNDSLAQTLESPRCAEVIEGLKKRLGIPLGKKVLLYAPTWRDSVYRAATGYGLGEVPGFERMHRALGDQWVLLLRAHYHVGDRQEAGAEGGFLIDASDAPDINELYLVADALLTDYSSTLFDYANTKRPIIYYWPDLAEYRDDIRGFYFDPQTLPGDKCANTSELIAALGALGTWDERHGESYRAFRKRFCPKDDGHATTRVIAALFPHARVCP